ncbi:MAG: aminoglycoside phosphotransferase family protein [Lachnospiraceae bacterium]|nr:aminoglycoside phosphotransferase family protein [Lachnospiraceae bacterium]
MMRSDETLKELQIINQFDTGQQARSAILWGNGHINRSFLATMESGERYILQRINSAVFQDVDGLMDNIVSVTSFLRERIQREGGDPKRGTLTVIPSMDGRPYWKDEEGFAWRLYANVERTVTYEKAEDENVMYQGGLAVGQFQALLADFPVEELHETIPDFHNTPKRYQTFEKVVSEDICGRAASVASEIAFIRERREEMSVFVEMQKKGQLPLRVTHNDTKINNILFDEASQRAVCLCDLDTVMPGFAAFDFGDAIRSGASTALEDEPDSSKVSLSLPLYGAYLKGFVEGTRGRLTEEEIRMLPMGAKLMTLECGMRFLTDYLQGDTYFKIEREHHNLDRCRTQLALVADMEKKWEQMAP